MRISTVIFAFFLGGCTLVGQQPSEEAKKEAEFAELMKKAKATQEVNVKAIQAADKKTSEKITKAANQIVSLKAEVKQLKTELNEANKKLDSTDHNSIDIKFNLLPISSGQENW
jgi:septal ring factor EnvC (AmiA/AmiB activator)